MTDLVSALIVALFTALVGSLLAWVVGTQVSYRWDDRKRRREADLAAATTFYQLYGTFFAT
jgi:membrane protein YqaA with SNARE-associated domain